MKHIVALPVFLLSILANNAQAAQGRYTLSMFERGVKETSSPRYVLFLVREPGSDSAQIVCSLGRSLIDAVQIEHDWDYAVAGRRKAKGLVLRHWNEPFAFEKLNAIIRAHPRYTQKQLAGIRAQLSRFTNRELRTQLRRRRSREPTQIQIMCRGKGAPVAYSTRNAIAHVLLERGILVANDARTGQLRLP